MPGDFSAEAYEQLRAAYAKETNTQLDAESEGVKILGQEMTLETLPVDSPWKSKIDNWQYPTGRSEYLDGKQDPAEVLAIMRGAAQEIDDAEKLEEAKELVAEAEAEEETESEEEEVETTAETEEVSDEDLGEMSDEEFEKFVDDILDGVGDEEELDEDEEEEEEADTEPVAEAEEAEEEETEEEYDPQDVADEISRLKDELENMRFVSTAEPTEEPAEDDQNDESD